MLTESSSTSALIAGSRALPVVTSDTVSLDLHLKLVYFFFFFSEITRTGTRWHTLLKNYLNSSSGSVSLAIRRSNGVADLWIEARRYNRSRCINIIASILFCHINSNGAGDINFIACVRRPCTDFGNTGAGTRLHSRRTEMRKLYAIIVAIGFPIFDNFRGTVTRRCRRY